MLSDKGLVLSDKGQVLPDNGQVLPDNGRVLSDKGLVLDGKQGTRWPRAVRQRNMADWEGRSWGGKKLGRGEGGAGRYSVFFCQDTSYPESGHIRPE